MRYVLLTAALFFIIAGLVMAALPLVRPMTLALGLGVGQGLGIMLGGFLLLALALLLPPLWNMSLSLHHLRQTTTHVSEILSAALVPRHADAAPPPPSQEPAMPAAEERMVRGRRVRLLPGGEVEAELQEGWLRFRNMQHLNEYLDALEQLRGKGLV